MSDLIDTTEMYLRTIFELEEEGVVPLRARIAERLGQSGPTVSQTVARMERDGLVKVEGDRHLELSDSGRMMATRVMRKHRLAECLLVEIIGLPWEDAHEEACRWEHVMSETVERRILELLDHPETSPFGNPIPGLAELGDEPHAEARLGLTNVDEVTASSNSPIRRTVRRIGEPVQNDHQLMSALRRAGVHPGATVQVQASPGGILIGSAGEYHEISRSTATLIFVDRA
ncbi:MAG: metal-dependent transcriptional regulator [Actinomycetes bacterium]